MHQYRPIHPVMRQSAAEHANNMWGDTIGGEVEVVTDLDYADHASLLAQMVEVICY